MEILLLLPVIFFGLSIVGSIAEDFLTKKAVKGNFLKTWKVSCFLSSIWIWAVVWIAFDIVVLFLWLADFMSSSFSTTIITTFIAGPFAAYIILRGSKLIDNYWKQLVSSLDKCKCLNQAQADNYKHEKPIMLTGSSIQRKNALTKVLSPGKVDVELMNYPKNDE